MSTPTLRQLAEQSIASGHADGMHQLACAAGMRAETLSRLIAGRMRRPGHLLMVGLANACGVSVDVVTAAWRRTMGEEA